MNKQHTQNPEHTQSRAAGNHHWIDATHQKLINERDALRAVVTEQQDLITSLLQQKQAQDGIISELAETLHAADPEARVSLLASQVLQLSKLQPSTDLPFD